MGLGDRIAVMSHGEVRQIGTPADVYDHPLDTFVATFIGSPPMNLVPMRTGSSASVPSTCYPSTSATAMAMPLKVDRIEYLSGDRHVYGTVQRIGEESRVIARLPSTITTPVAAGETHEFAVHATPAAVLRPRDRSAQRADPAPGVTTWA